MRTRWNPAPPFTRRGGRHGRGRTVPRLRAPVRPLTRLCRPAIIGSAEDFYITPGNHAVAKGKPISRKRRTREHVIADLSVNYVERQVLLCGFTVERRWHDYGFDLFMNTYDPNGEIECGEVHF